MPKLDSKAHPGPWTLRVIPYHKDDPQDLPVHAAISSSGTLVEPGWTLDRFKEHLGGEQGHLEDPEGKLHQVSLTPWLHMDPLTTRFRVQFVGPMRQDRDGSVRREMGI